MRKKRITNRVNPPMRINLDTSTSHPGEEGILTFRCLLMTPRPRELRPPLQGQASIGPQTPQRNQVQGNFVQTRWGHAVLASSGRQQQYGTTQQKQRISTVNKFPKLTPTYLKAPRAPPPTKGDSKDPESLFVPFRSTQEKMKPSLNPQIPLPHYKTILGTFCFLWYTHAQYTCPHPTVKTEEVFLSSVTASVLGPIPTSPISPPSTLS